MEEDGVVMMVVRFPASCAAAVAAERECKGAREVRCIVVASKLVQPWLLHEDGKRWWRCHRVREVQRT